MAWDYLRYREQGLLAPDFNGLQSHRPSALYHAVGSDAGLVSRLQHSCQLPATGAQLTAAWSSDGSRVVSGGEDCRLAIWRGDGSGQLLHTVDTGHTSSILAARFLPTTCDQVICGAADKQIRHINLTRGAARPYMLHKGRVRALVPLDAYVVLSGSEDGTVREVDVRVKPPPLNRTQELQAAAEDYNVLVDQRAERIGRSRAKVGIFSIAVDEFRPWLILTGGTDPLLRLYDRRMLPPPSDGHGSRSKAPQWASCFIPAHLKADLWDSRPAAASLTAPGAQGYQLTAVSFARGGTEVVGSYSGHCIYSFDATEHARDVESLLHVPESVLRIPTRPRSNVRRSAHQWAPLQLGQARSPHQQQQQPHQQPARQHAYQGLSQAGSMQQLGGGGAAIGAQHGQQGHSQGAGGAAPRSARQRSMGIGASLRHLEHLRRQHSQMHAAPTNGVGGEHAESSRQANWQQRPSSSTLRSPLHRLRYLSASGGGGGSASQREQQAQQSQGEQQRQHLGGWGPGHHQHQYLTESGSEMSGEGSPRVDSGERRGVRRSRRLSQRRRGLAAHAADATAAYHAAAAGASIAEEVEAEEALQMAIDEGVVVAEAGSLPRPAVSGNAEHSGASESDAEMTAAPAPATAAVHSPSRRRASRRLAAAAAAAAAATAGVEGQGQQVGAGDREPGAGTGEAPAGTQEGVGPSGAGGGDFKHPGAGGRLPPRQSRHAAHRAAQAAAAVFDTGWVDSTLGVLHHHAVQPDSSEVAAASPAGHPARGSHPAQHAQQAHAPQQAQQELTVDMQQPTAQGSGGGGGARGKGMSPVAEVTSRPVLSASAIGAAAPQPTGGHEVSSLNSAGVAALERVDSVVQQHRVDAPSVGNAPRAATTLGTTAQRREAPEASTGHVGPLGACLAAPGQDSMHPPQHAQQAQQAVNAQQQQHQPMAGSQQGPLRRQGGTQQWQQAGAGLPGRHALPTASTGASRPPSLGAAAEAGAAGGMGAATEGTSTLAALANGRGSLRLRRHAMPGQASAQQEVSHAGAGAAAAVSPRTGAGEASTAPAGSVRAEAPPAIPRTHHNLRRQHQQTQQAQQATPQWAAGGRQAGADAGAGLGQTQQAQHAQQQPAASLLEPQQTMLSGRGPSTVGNFLPSSQQAQQGSEVEAGGESIGGEDRGAPQQAQQAGSGHQGQPEQAGQHIPPETNLGAILHMADTEGEEVMEPTMFRRCYWGHLNLMEGLDGNGVAATPNMAFLGANSEFLACPSDDGTIFLWDYSSGSLVGVLESGSEGAVSCVAAHPHGPMLASCGKTPTVHLWSPEAEERLSMARSREIVERNAWALLQADLQPPAQPPPGVALLGGGSRGHQAYRGEDGRQVRCHMM